MPICFGFAHSGQILALRGDRQDSKIHATPCDASDAFDPRRFDMRILAGKGCNHVRMDGFGRVLRLDVIEGAFVIGPVLLRFELIHDWRLPAQLRAVRAFCEMSGEAPARAPPHTALARRCLALEAIDLRSAGTSLRDIADRLLGDGAWPGDGEYRKSQARRLIAAGEKMIRAGPQAFLV